MKQGPRYSRAPERLRNWLPSSAPIKLLHYGFIPTGSVFKGVGPTIPLYHGGTGPPSKLCNVQFAQTLPPEFSSESTSEGVSIALDSSLLLQPLEHGLQPMLIEAKQVFLWVIFLNVLSQKSLGIGTKYQPTLFPVLSPIV